jgi:hypothetical protein
VCFNSKHQYTTEWERQQKVELEIVNGSIVEMNGLVRRDLEGSMTVQVPFQLVKHFTHFPVYTMAIMEIVPWATVTNGFKLRYSHGLAMVNCHAQHCLMLVCHWCHDWTQLQLQVSTTQYGNTLSGKSTISLLKILKSNSTYLLALCG